MLAIETGWTPDMLAEMPARFIEACRWAIYARTLAGPNGLPSGEVPQGAAAEVLRDALRIREQVTTLRTVLYPEDD